MQLLRKKGNLDSTRVLFLPIDAITPNPNQPRRIFSQHELEELAASIRSLGLLQPLTVRRTASGCELVAGERRLRAAGMAGLRSVPCVVLDIDREDSAVLALIENLQRSDLHYLEEAAAMARLLETCRISQEELAARLGKSQSAVANKLRLLRLSGACGDLLRSYHLTERHARALLRLSDEEERLRAARHIGEKHLNVAQTEQYIESLLSDIQQTEPARRPAYIVKDVRLFLNSIRHSVDVMRRSGVDAQVHREESEEAIVLTVRIPKGGTAAALDKPQKR